MRFIHAADIHLDSPLTGLERYEGAPHDALRGAARHAFRNLVRVAISERVDFVVIAGDLYDSDWRDYNTGLFLAKQMSELREYGIRVFIVSGNHDAQSEITKSLRLPDNVTVFPTRNAETVEIHDLGVAIHGRSYEKRAETDNFVPTYPVPVSGMLNIGILHTNVDGQPGHDNYAPCRLDELRNKGYDYWALGHIHERAVLSEDPWIVYPGNIQGRHIRETGVKGCTIVSVDDGRIRTIEPVELDVARWELCTVDVDGCETGDEVVARVSDALQRSVANADDRLLAVRIEVTGACKAHDDLVANPKKWDAQIRGEATGFGATPVWIEKIRFGTSVQYSLEEMERRDDAIGDLLRSIRELGDDDRVRDLVSDVTTDLNQKLPVGIDASYSDAESVRELIEDVRQMLISRLLSTGGAS